MVQIRSIGVWSAAKMSAVVYAFIGLLAGLLFSLAALAGVATNVQGGGAGAMLFGVGAIVVLPLLYGLMGTIVGVISALIYNVVAAVAGGIELDLRPTHGGVPPRLP
jgi:hypothetical protein